MNSLSLQTFVFQSPHDVRMVMHKHEPWWVASDVCAILDIQDVKQAVERLDEDERGRYNVPSPGGVQQTTCINESGLYSLIFTSRKPEAKAFKRWVTHEVLPSIRKTGSYTLASHANPEQQREKILQHIDKRGETTSREIQQYVHLDFITASERVQELLEAGSLTALKQGKTTLYKRS